MIDTSSFKLLNKATGIIQRAEDLSRSTPNVAIRKNGRQLRFNGAAATYCDLRIGMYMHFINPIGNTWYFIVNNVSTGFRVSTGGGELKDMIVTSKAIVDMVTETTGHKYPSKFLIQKTTSEFKGCALFEILTNKPISELGKSNKPMRR